MWTLTTSKGLASKEELPNVFNHSCSLLIGCSCNLVCRVLVTYESWLSLSNNIRISSCLPSPIATAWAVCSRKNLFSCDEHWRWCQRDHWVGSDASWTAVLWAEVGCSQIDWWWHLWQYWQFFEVSQSFSLYQVLRQLKHLPDFNKISFQLTAVTTAVQEAVKFTIHTMNLIITDY